MKNLLFVCLTISSYASELYFENFDSTGNKCIIKHMEKRPNIYYGNYGSTNSKGIQVTYVGASNGSLRNVFQCALKQRVKSATLHFDVKFNDNFQFVKGGKLHGLGPEKPSAGGERHGLASWSARVMFLKGGHVGLYLYDQDQTQTYGTTYRAKNFQFRKNRFYRISLYVKVNSNADSHDGVAILSIDGKKLVVQENIRFRGLNGEEGLISKLLFNTFHGGHDKSWAPKDVKGNFINVDANFDNFKVDGK